MKSAMGMISSSFNSWRHLAMLAFKLDIIKRSLSRTADTIGSLVGIDKDLLLDYFELLLTKAET
eukprot:9955068-Ditylum_brightwellii.AAC.1